MAKKKRISIPQNVKDTLLFESDHTCCICGISGKGAQIHHIDGDPSNNEFENLILLCLEHHEEAERKSGMAAGRTSGELKKYRTEWYERVKQKRITGMHHKSNTFDTTNDDFHYALVDAIASHEIRKMDIDLRETDWEKMPALLKPLHSYTYFTYGFRPRRELLSVLRSVVGRTRRKMPSHVAQTISDLAGDALPINSLVGQAINPHTDQDIQLMKTGCSLGFGLAYDGVKYLKDISVVDAGASLLWRILRCAHLNDDLAEVKKYALSEFERLNTESIKHDFEDARIWIQFQKDDALALDGDPLPKYPSTIQRKIDKLCDNLP